MLMSHFVTDQVGRYKNLTSGGEVLVWSFNIGENKKKCFINHSFLNTVYTI